MGGNFCAARGLDERAMSRTLSALAGLAEWLKLEKVDQIFAVATGVVREAKNGQEFLRRIFQQTSLPIRLISGEEEARLMLKGVMVSLGNADGSRLVADVGGWSTEVIWAEGDCPQKVQTVGLGAVALCEKFLKNDPPSPREMASLETYVRKILEGILTSFIREELKTEKLNPNLVGTAGTVTTLAAIDLQLRIYDSQRVNGHRLPLSRLQEMYRSLRTLPLAARKKILGLEQGREDLILAGTAVVLILLEVFQLKGLMVIDTGLLEGVLLEGMEQGFHP